MNTGSWNFIVKLLMNVSRNFMNDKVNIVCLMMKTTQHMCGKRFAINALNVFIYKRMKQVFPTIWKRSMINNFLQRYLWWWGQNTTVSDNYVFLWEGYASPGMTSYRVDLTLKYILDMLYKYQVYISNCSGVRKLWKIGGRSSPVNY